MRRAAATLVTAAFVVTAVHAVATRGVAATTPGSSAYVAVGPVRLADTRSGDCGCTRLSGDTVRVDVAGHPDVPDDAVAAAVTITALPTASPAFVTAYPGGTQRPLTSTVNTVPGRAVANSAIVPLGDDGTLDVFTKLAGDVVVDVTGAFVPAATARAGRFVAVDPQRVLDTRSGAPLPPGGERGLAQPAGGAPDAIALVVNVTSVDAAHAGHFTARRAGAASGQPTSFLNVDGSGRAVAALAILPLSAEGAVITATGGGHVIVDLIGWFTGPSQAESSVGLFVPAPPARLLDTRATGPRLYAGGTREIEGVAGAQALVTNVTAVAADWRGHVTAYPAGMPLPDTSTVNPLYHDHTVANMAITATSTRGVAYRSLAGTDLVVDITGYFTGTPFDPTTGVPTNPDVAPRVLIVGDSAMAAVNVYTDSQRALQGAEFHIDADNCRRLVHQSCLSDVTARVPDTALEAIQAAPGPFDIVYMDVGHNDWFDDDFAWQFDVIVEAARQQGAKVILWATYTEHVSIQGGAAEAYAWNNAYLRHLTALPQYSDVLLADWSGYSSTRPEWFWDGTHMYAAGAYGVADYMARWAAAITHRACPQPHTPGGAVDNPCVPPDTVGPPPDVMALYP